jgi:hypothetical protein
MPTHVLAEAIAWEEGRLHGDAAQCRARSFDIFD